VVTVDEHENTESDDAGKQCDVDWSREEIKVHAEWHRQARIAENGECELEN
jgi:hypothetical protein